jgi:hypothetical protein
MASDDDDEMMGAVAAVCATIVTLAIVLWAAFIEAKPGALINNAKAHPTAAPRVTSSEPSSARSTKAVGIKPSQL